MEDCLKKFITEVNIFKSPSSNDRQIHFQRHATRLYGICLLISVGILASYTLLSETVHRQVISNPTASDYFQLEQTHSSRLSCPCSSISIPFARFISIEAHYHQLCSSVFVSSQWINYTAGYLPRSLIIFIPVFATDALAKYQWLVTLCRQAHETIDHALDIFLQRQLVSARVIPEQLFASEMNIFIRDWQTTTVNEYVRTMQMIRTTTHGNQLMTGGLNVQFSTDTQRRETTMLPVKRRSCPCILSPSCSQTMPMYGTMFTDGNRTVPSAIQGCSLLEGVFAWTLECFYYQWCIASLDRYMLHSGATNVTFTALDPNLSSVNETVDSMIQRLLVDSWSSNASFISYFNSCAPQFCTFDYRRRNDLFFVIITIVSVVGGLSLAFKLIIFIGLQLLEKRINGFRWVGLMHGIRSHCACGDEHRMICRLHFVLLAVILGVLYSYSTFTPHERTVEVHSPSLITYENLHAQYPVALECPCSQISIQYRSFLTVVPRFHSVCASDFVSERWISHLYDIAYNRESYPSDDFLRSAVVQFQLIAAFCQLSKQIVNETFAQLGTNGFITSRLLSSQQLDERIQTTMNELQSVMPNSFLSILSLIRETTAANKLVSILSINWLVAIPPIIRDSWTAHTVPLVYQGCSCGFSSKCVQASRGMLAGCYPLETVLQSTLQYLYDPNDLFETIQIPSINSTRFDMNASIESIVGQLMVEEYFKNMSYEDYFTDCAPSSCSYTYVNLGSTVEGITTLISLYGGLLLISRVIAVIIVRLLRYPTQRVIPATA